MVRRLFALALIWAACAPKARPPEPALTITPPPTIPVRRPTPLPSEGPRYTLKVVPAQTPAPLPRPTSIAESEAFLGWTNDQATPRVEVRPANESEIEMLLADSKPRSPAPLPAAVETSTLGFVLSPRPRPWTPATELGVAHFAPAGTVTDPKRVTIIFSEPMQATGTARIAPPVPGQWRWIDRIALVFEPATRFAMATDYEVEIPARLLAVSGKRLAAPVRFHFTTPAPTLRSGPSPEIPRRSAIVLSFDQVVDPKAVLAATRLFGPSGPIAFGLGAPRSDRSEVELRPKSPLAPGARFRLAIDSGLPSAEGKRRTISSIERTFRTLPAPKIVRTGCRAVVDCPPGAALEVVFDRPIASASLAEAPIIVSPNVPGLEAKIDEGALVLEGPTKGKTKYEIHIGPGLRDERGDEVGELTTSVTTGRVPPTLGADGRALSFVDPGASLPITSVNYPRLIVEIRRVEPADWPAYLRWSTQPPGSAQPPGVRVDRRTITVEGAPDQPVTTDIDLGPALTASVGHAIVEVRPTRSTVERWQKRAPPTIRRWVEVTGLAIDAQVDFRQALVWVTDAKTGQARRGAAVRLSTHGKRALTDPSGVAILPLPNPDPKAEDGMLVVESGADRAFLPESRWFQGQSRWARRSAPAGHRFVVIDPVEQHRVGDVARVRIWARAVDPGPLGKLSPADPDLRCRYRLIDSAGVVLQSGEVLFADGAAADLDLAIPIDATPGMGELELGVEGEHSNHHHLFGVVRHRRYASTLEIKGAGRAVVTDQILLQATLRYPSGEPISNVPLNWKTRAIETRYRPPGMDAFSFGRATPAWLDPPRAATLPSSSYEASGPTDAGGQAALEIGLERSSPPRPMSLAIEAEAAGVSARATVVVHPARYLVGLKAESAFTLLGSPIRLQAIVTDLDGRFVPDRKVSLDVVRLLHRTEGAELQTIETAVDYREVDSSHRTIELVPTLGGPHRIRARVIDDDGIEDETELLVVVSGQLEPRDKAIAERRVELIPAQKRYRVGEVAEILVEAPAYPVEALLTVRRGGILKHRRFTIAGPSHLLQLRLGPDAVPSVELALALAGPLAASGTLILPVDSAEESLSALLGHDTDPTKIYVSAPSATDVWAYVLPHLGHLERRPDLLSALRPTRGGETQSLRSRDDRVTGPTPATHPSSRARAPARSTSRPDPVLDDGIPAIHEARRLSAVRSARTGPDGKVELHFADLEPGRYRVVVVADDRSQRFATSEGELAFWSPLDVVASAPPFVRLGDRPEVDFEVRGLIEQATVGVTGDADSAQTLLTRGRVHFPWRTPGPLEWVARSKAAVARGIVERPVLEPDSRTLGILDGKIVAGEAIVLSLPQGTKAASLTVAPEALAGIDPETLRAPEVSGPLDELALQLRVGLALRAAREDAQIEPSLSEAALVVAERLVETAPIDLDALEAVIDARTAGVAIPEGAILDGLSRLENLGPDPGGRREAKALALAAELGRFELSRARKLARTKDLDDEAAARLWVLLRGTDSERAVVRLEARLTALLASGPAAADAAWLEALSEAQPEHPALRRLRQRLYGTRSAEAAIALIRSAPKSDSALSVVAKSGAQYDLSLPFGLALPVQATFPAPDPTLTLAALGEGHARYRVVAFGSVAEPLGLGVERTWAPSGPFQIGDLVVVRIEVVIPKAVSGLSIIDPFPAGLVPVRSTLAPKPPFTRIALRRGQVEVETGPLGPGIVTFEYQARARHTGRYQAPPVEVRADDRGGHAAAATIEIAQ